MAAFECYANATRFVMDSHDLDNNYFLLIQEALTPLRFYLSCRVCDKLLSTPMSPDHTACQHTVCRNCIGGKMKLKPSCGWCQKYTNFIENKPLATLVQCYSTLCEYVINSVDYRKQMDYINKCTPSTTNHQEEVASLLKEACEAKITTTDALKPNHREDNVNLASNEASKQSFDTTVIKDSKPTQLQHKYRGDLKLKLVISGRNKLYHTKNKTAHASKRLKKKIVVFGKKRRKINSSNKEIAQIADVGEENQLNIPPKKVKRQAADFTQPYTGLESLTKEADGESKETKKARKLDKSRSDRKGCGCGVASSSSGKLTCYGQRCPCYSSHAPCVDCKCRGCRNPNKIVKIEHTSEDTDGEINVE